jgi:Ca2+-binding RTX toxin-like protein
MPINRNSIRRISVAGDGSEGSEGAGGGVFSPDGSKVAFLSSSPELVPGGGNGTITVLVKDLRTGVVTEIGVAAGGGSPDDHSAAPVFSPDGSKIAFLSWASNLVAGDTNKTPDLFVKDLVTGVVTRVSTTASGAQSHDSDSTSFDDYVFSADGRKIAFTSYASDLVAGDGNGQPEIFIKDLVSGAVTRVGVTKTGVEADGSLFHPIFSPDGSKIAFESTATNLVPGDTGEPGGLFVKDLASGAITRVGPAAIREAAFSADWSKVAFVSSSSSLVAGDGNERDDVFVQDLRTGTITRVNTTADGRESAGWVVGGPVFSPDGTKVAFYSDAPGLDPADTGYVTDLFVKDLATGAITRISLAASGVPADGDSYDLSFSPDGRALIFTSNATNLVVGDGNDLGDVFVVSLAATDGDDVLQPLTRGETMNGQGGADTLLGSLGADTLIGGAGADRFAGTVAELNGDTIKDLAPGEVLEVRGASFTAADVRYLAGGQLAIDTNHDGKTDLALTVAGLNAPSFTTKAIASGTEVRLVPPPSSLAIAAGSADRVEGQSGTTAFTFVVTRTGDLSAEVTAAWTVAGNGSAAASAADFAGGALPSGTVSFAAGEASRTITVNVAGDTVWEGNEGFKVTLSSPTNGATIATATAVGTIRNDDAAPPPELSIAATSAVKAEGSSGSTAFTFTVTRAFDPAKAVTVDWRVAGEGGSPAVAADFAGGVLPHGTLSFAAGELTKTITVNVVGDATYEASEGFKIVLDNPTGGALLGTAVASAVVQNDDWDGLNPMLGTDDADLVNGTSGGDWIFGQDGHDNLAGWAGGDRLEGDAGDDLLKGHGGADRLEGGTGDDRLEGGVDGDVLTGGSGSDRFAGTVAELDGDTITDLAAGDVIEVRGVTFTATDLAYRAGGLLAIDTDQDGTADLTLTLQDVSAPAFTVTTTASGTEIELDPSPAVLAIAAAAADRAEGQSGTTAFTFQVTRSGDVSAAVSVGYTVTGSGTAAASAADFAGGAFPSGRVSFAAGETTKTITVNVAGEGRFEAAEGFQVTLGSPGAGGMIDPARASAQAVIRNDDAPPTLSIAALTADRPEGSSGATAFTFTVTRTGDTGEAVSAAWSLAGEGASPVTAADFAGGALPSGTVSFAAGETTKTITVDVAGDTLYEAAEAFRVTLSALSGDAVLGTASAVGTIRNDDPMPPPVLSIAAADAVKVEGSASVTAFTFTVTRADDPAKAVAATWSVAGSGGTPATAADFAGGVLPSGTVSFAAGETTKTITVNVVGDAIHEAGEGFTVTLASPTNGAVLGVASAAATIQNDDWDGFKPVLGNDGANLLNGTNGGDWIFGYGGADTLQGWASDDRIEGGDGNDVLRGHGGADLLEGGAGDDLLESGSGSDTLEGGAGADRFGGSVSELAGDTIRDFDLGDVLEVRGPGFGVADMTYGPGGRLAIDTNRDGTADLTLTLAGLTSPTFATKVVGSITEIRLVPPLLSVAAADAVKAEGDSGATAFTFTVTRSVDLARAVTVDWHIEGDGGAPADAADFAGGVLPSGTVSFAVGETTKTITVSVLGDGAVEAEEGFTLVLADPTGGAVLGAASATGAIRNDDPARNPITGDDGANLLNGTNGADLVQGLEGDDRVYGWGGDDRLEGGAGDDLVRGHGGADVLLGGAGADRFIYGAAGDSGAAAMDTILDFSSSQGDKIDLAALDANPAVAGDQALAFVGTAAFTGVGQVRHAVVDGRTQVEVSLDADPAAELTFQLDQVVALKAGDFLL